MRVFFSLKLTLLTCCSPLAPSFARMSACSLPNIPQCAGIDCRTALLVVATCCRALVRFGTLWLWYACRTERASERNTTCLQSWSEAWTTEAAWMRASVSARQFEQCLPTATLAETFCPPGKWTSIPAPPLVTAFVADPSVNTLIHASCGYLSAFIARVRDCSTVSSCVSPLEREGTVVWTLMSVMSNTQGSGMSGGKKGSVLWGSLSWNWRLSFLLSWTKLLLFSRFLVRPSSLVFMGWFVKHLNFSACIMFLASLRWPRGWTSVSLSISEIGVDRIAPVIRRSAWFWTLSRACWLAFAVVDHAMEPYSRSGLTVPWYTVVSTFSLAPQMVPASLRRIAILRLAFPSALAMCCFSLHLIANVLYFIRMLCLTHFHFVLVSYLIMSVTLILCCDSLLNDSITDSIF